MFHRDVGAPVLEREQKFVADGSCIGGLPFDSEESFELSVTERGLFGRVRRR